MLAGFSGFPSWRAAAAQGQHDAVVGLALLGWLLGRQVDRFFDRAPIMVAVFMARQNQNPGSLSGQTANINNAQVAQAAALDDDAETPAPEVLAKQAAPALSPAEEIAALQAKIDALKATTQQPDEVIPGSTIRPVMGMLHATLGTPIFNAGRPTGRAG